MKGDWFQSLKGRQIWPLDPRPEDVDVDEIAHALSNICRFGGHAPFYSVAQHSVYVSRCAAESHPDFAMAALLHDAPEAFLGDVIRPLKRGGGVTEAYLAAESAWARTIAIALDVPWLSEPLAPSIKVADARVLMAERRDLLAPIPAPWGPNQGVSDLPPWEKSVLPCWTPEEARRRFLLEYRALRAGRRAEDVEREEREAMENKMRADGDALRVLLEPHCGKWVALDWHWREVFYAHADHKELVRWIRENRPREDQPTMVYRVPGEKAPPEPEHFAFKGARGTAT